jgi:Protein of unknown function (DUF2637)
MSTKLRELLRLRRLVLAVVVMGIGSSVTLNVMHAPHNVGARLVAALPPLAVFVCIELVSRIPSSSPLLSAGRVFASLAVAGIGGSISYVQQMAYVTQLGYSGWIATIFPGCIDGVMMVATLSLVEVVRKVRQVRETEDAQSTTVAAVRAANDQHESPATLAYRRDAAKLRQLSAVPSLNGKPAEVVQAQ